ncbi:hypothetical protein AAFF_G00434350 [Aldrovandia affinis]|uniref:Uncharacterized protein n=1 Tax=Aldrovandia affinis TaxID=143900 RepID=A0AAD7SAF7_9TELE|nr:hypothetical protein AAFF_G00434350 [Aldrovandia affinis]
MRTASLPHCHLKDKQTRGDEREKSAQTRSVRAKDRARGVVRRYRSRGDNGGTAGEASDAPGPRALAPPSRQSPGAWHVLGDGARSQRDGGAAGELARGDAIPGGALARARNLAALEEEETDKGPWRDRGHPLQTSCSCGFPFIREKSRKELQTKSDILHKGQAEEPRGVPSETTIHQSNAAGPADRPPQVYRFPRDGGAS